MDNLQMARAFNEWMRRFIEEPDRFEREFTTVNAFLADKNDGKEPSYGETCSAYMQDINAELEAA